MSLTKLTIQVVEQDRAGRKTPVTTRLAGAAIKFINRKVDSWDMVWLVWIVGFTTTLLQKYYWTTISDYIYLKVRNDNVKTIDCDKNKLAYVIFFKIIINTILGILAFFTYLTAQLQFIIPGVITSILIYIPLELHKLNKKIYVKK